MFRLRTRPGGLRRRDALGSADSASRLNIGFPALFGTRASLFPDGSVLCFLAVSLENFQIRRLTGAESEVDDDKGRTESDFTGRRGSSSRRCPAVIVLTIASRPIRLATSGPAHPLPKEVA